MRLEVRNINDLKPNEFKIRVTDQDTIELIELGQSIRDNGLLQPIVIDTENNIIAGHRRFLACLKMEIEEIETLILDSQDHSPLLLNIIENIQREDLTDIEIALSLKQLKDTLKCKQSELAHLVKKSDSVVSKFLSLLTLHNEIQDDLIDNKRILSKNVLLRMAAMPEPIKEQQKEIYNKYAKEQEINSQEAVYLINESINDYYNEDIYKHSPEVLFSKHSLQVKNISVPKDKQELFEKSIFMLIDEILND